MKIKSANLIKDKSQIKYSLTFDPNSVQDYIPEYFRGYDTNKFLALSHKTLVYPTRKLIRKTPMMFLSKSFIVNLTPDKRYREVVIVPKENVIEIITKYIKVYPVISEEFAQNEKFSKTLIHDTKNLYINIQAIYNQSMKLHELDYKYSNVVKSNLKIPRKSILKELVKELKKVETLKLQFFPELETFLVLFFIPDKRVFNFLAVEIFNNIIRFITYKYFKNEKIRKSYEYFPLDLYGFYEKKFNTLTNRLFVYKKAAEKDPVKFIDYVVFAYRNFVSLRNTINTSIREYAQQFYKDRQYMENLNENAYEDDEKYEKLDLVKDYRYNPEEIIAMKEILDKLREVAEKYEFKDFDAIIDSIISNDKRRIKNKNSRVQKFIKIAREELKGVF